MTRRGFISLLGISALTWPRIVCAQQPEPIRRVGVLHSVAEDDPEGQARMAAFLQGLRQSGWTIGRNLTIYTRWGRANAEVCRGTGRACSRRHSRHRQRDCGTIAAGYPHGADRVRLRSRSCRRRLRRQFGTTGRQRDGIYAIRIQYWWEMARVAQADG